MSISGIWSNFSTHQPAIFAQARRDAVIFAPGCVARPLWTSRPRPAGSGPTKVKPTKSAGAKRLSGHENFQRRVRDVNES